MHHASRITGATFFEIAVYVICLLKVGPYGEKLWPRAWKCCPKPSQFFTIRTCIFSCSKLVLQPTTNWVCLRNFVITRVARRLLTICKKFSQGMSNSDTRQRKMYSLNWRTNIFQFTLCQLHLCHLSSSPRLFVRREISYEVYKNNFGQSCIPQKLS